MPQPAIDFAVLQTPLMALSTAHMSETDNALCLNQREKRVDDSGRPLRILDVNYGFQVCLPSDGDLRERALMAATLAGFSSAFIGLLEMAAAAGFCRIEFDRDAAVVDGLEIFEW